MFAVAGTVPIQDFPLVAGEVFLEDDSIFIHGNEVPVNRGTPALLAAVIKVCEVLDQGAPFGYLVGDIGLGDGSHGRHGRYFDRHCNGFGRNRHGDYEGSNCCCNSESARRALRKAYVGHTGDGDYSAYTDSSCKGS